MVVSYIFMIISLDFYVIATSESTCQQLGTQEEAECAARRLPNPWRQPTTCSLIGSYDWYDGCGARPRGAVVEEWRWKGVPWGVYAWQFF